MKLLNSHKIALVVGLLVFSSCQKDFLERSPSDRPANEFFFSNETELLLALNGAYEGLYWQSGRTPYPVWFDSSTDISFNRGDYAGMFTVQSGQFSTETSVFYSVWSSLYDRIARCNNILSNMHKAKDVISEETYVSIEAQAKFLRAFFYQYLINLYGDVPFVTTLLPLEEAKVERVVKDDIVRQLYDDLDFSAEHLPERWVGDDSGRITRGAALSLKARIALLEGDYQIAAQAAKTVIDSKVYELYPDYSKLFLLAGKGSTESIFHLPSPASGNALALPLFSFSGFLTFCSNFPLAPVPQISYQPSKGYETLPILRDASCRHLLRPRKRPRRHSGQVVRHQDR